MRGSTVDIEVGVFEVPSSMQSETKTLPPVKADLNETEFLQTYLEIHNSNKQFQQCLQMSAV